MARQGAVHMASNTDRQQTTDKFITALKRDQFVLYAQPIMPMQSVAGAAGYQEILIRYLEEEEKLLHPGGFIPILESLKLMPMLDRWVVNRVLRWIREKRRVGKDWSPPCCSINLSADSIVDPEFPGYVKELLQAGAIPPDRLSFEIAETDARAHLMALGSMTQELRPLGCTFALTNFTGEEVSAKWLQMLGVGLAKIASGTIDGIDRDNVLFAKANAIHLACRELGVRTIGVFVERPETLEKLKVIGMDYAQGYGIARPAPLV